MVTTHIIIIIIIIIRQQILISKSSNENYGSLVPTCSIFQKVCFTMEFELFCIRLVFTLLGMGGGPHWE